MRAKTIVTIVLLLFVAASGGYLAVKELSAGSGTAPASNNSAPEVAAVNEPAAVAANPEVVVYYFHGSVRCPTCRKFESYCDELMRQDFAEELNDGRLQWRIVNVDEPENKHFVNDYQLYTKSIVVVKSEPPKPQQWKNLDKIWELVRDKQAFVGYVKEEINEYLRADL